MAAKKKAATKDESADEVRVGAEPVPGLKLRCVCRGHDDAINRIAWSPCGRFIASPSDDRTARIWDALSANCVAVLEGHKGRVYSVAWSAESSKLASSGSRDGLVRLWDVEGGRECRALAGHKTGHVYSLVWSPDGRMLASASGFDENKLLVWESGTWGLLHVVEGGVGDFASLAWSPDSESIATGPFRRARGIQIWGGRTARRWRVLRGNAEVLAVAWYPDGRTLLSADSSGVIGVWDVESSLRTQSVEGHLDRLDSVSVSADGRLVATRGHDETFRLWRWDDFSPICSVPETTSRTRLHSLAFHPSLPILATLGCRDSIVRIWELDVEALLGIKPAEKLVRYTSAKIVLVGESNVGKSCLAMRLAEDRYPEDYEHETTHGMRFWPMEAQRLHPSAKAPKGQRRDVVLWDFGGQDEYRLVHQLFLHNTTLALVLVDPTRGRAALDEAREWNKRLEKHLGGRQAVKLLVGAKQDKESALVDRAAIETLCDECGFGDFIELSAKTGRNVARFRKAVADALDWEHLAKTSRPELFQCIRDHVEERRRSGEIVVLLDDLRAAIRKAHRRIYEGAAVKAVAGQLAAQGVIAQTRLAGGEEVVVLQLPVIERYAGSVIRGGAEQPAWRAGAGGAAVGVAEASAAGVEEDGAPEVG